MIVESSHLALRFYKSDGWTGEILWPCLDSGQVELTGGEGWWYWRLASYSRFNVEKLMKHITKVVRWYDGDDRETDEQYVEGMNW